MNVTDDFKNAMGLVPLRYQKAVLTLLAPHFSPEMLAVSVEYLRKDETHELSPPEIIELIFKVVGDITGLREFRKCKTRKADFVFSRQLAMFTLYNSVPHFSYQYVANLFTPRFDHATTVHACKSMEARYSTNKATRETINDLANILAEYGLYGLQNRLNLITRIA